VKQLGQYPAPRHTIAHLSDPHLLAGGRLQYDAVDTDAGLVRALERLAAVDPVPQALVLTGDLADRAEPEAYARLRELVEPAAEAMGATVVWTMGNHDERAPYARALFGSDDDGPQDRVHEVDGLRIVALDTSVPGYHHGDLTDAQLEWLDDVLATPAPHGTLLAMHHPPLPLPMLRGAELIELRGQDRLAAVVEGTDVRGILAGHLHFSTWSTFAGVPVSVASASCYTSDPAPVERFISGVDANQAFTMVHAYDDRLVHTIVPLVPGPEVNGLGLDIRDALESLDLAEAVELASSKASPFNVGETTAGEMA
jgi:3',5'-cyclic-AMP phosphodiesterase